MSSRRALLLIIAVALPVCAGLSLAGPGAVSRGAYASVRTLSDTVTPGAVTSESDPTPDFDGDGTVGFADFVLFAARFGSRQGEEAYDAGYDLDSDGEVGFSDFVLFARNFGREVASPVVAIPDDNLRAVIADSLGRALDAPITRADMAGLTHLRAGYKSIGDLTGLEFAVNLRFLDLAGNDLEDVGALAGLTNLTSLYLDSNAITDIAALSGLSSLTGLGLNGNRIENLSPLSGLNRLKLLFLGYNHTIADVSPLADLTNLKRLWLQSNEIADVSDLAGLQQLDELRIKHNLVTDVSGLAELHNLSFLDLAENNVTDIAALGHLTNLIFLDLAVNDVSGISALAGLTNLTRLNLRFNAVADVSALSALTNLEEVDLRGNPLSESSVNDLLSTLESNGVSVSFDRLRRNDFDVELVFLGGFTEKQEDIIRYGARRWMTIITDDLPDYVFNTGWTGKCHGRTFDIPSGERIDDLRIYVATIDSGPAGYGAPHGLRDNTFLPVFGCVGINLKSSDLLFTGLHEIGHVLGFGTIWDDLGFLQDMSRDNPDADPHFNGPLAVAAFDEAGGRNYTGAKVPVQRNSGAHWRYGVMEQELMSPGGGRYLSSITVQSLADLGYGVDATMADDYALPSPASKREAAKITEEIWSREPVLGRGGRNPTQRLTRDLQAAPEVTCSSGRSREPIYVVDPQGRVIRTIGER